MSEFPGILCIYTALAGAGRISLGRKFYFNFAGRCCHYGEINNNKLASLIEEEILHFLFYVFYQPSQDPIAMQYSLDVKCLMIKACNTSDYTFLLSRLITIGTTKTDKNHHYFTKVKL